MAWSPLGGGNILNNENNEGFKNIITIANELANQYQTTVNQILIAWLMAHSAKIIPVLGTSKLERLIEAKTAANITLQQEDWFKLYAASTGQEVA
ncbi:MAG: aldo/keto reductase, partial [Deinococcales bacterium]|nr:aldo/keto reductase [Chitinophagaceae bacterium]